MNRKDENKASERVHRGSKVPRKIQLRTRRNLAVTQLKGAPVVVDALKGESVDDPANMVSGRIKIPGPPDTTAISTSNMGKVLTSLSCRGKFRVGLVQPHLLKEYGFRLESIVGCIRTLLDICHVFGLKHPDDLSGGTSYNIKYFSSIDVALERAVTCVMADGKDNAWIKYFKYKTSAYFAAWHEQTELPQYPFGDPPEWENPKYIFGGVIGKWMLQLRFKNRLMYSCFSLSILMAKKGMPRADERLCEAAEVDCVKKLTTVKCFKEEVLNFQALQQMPSGLLVRGDLYKNYPVTEELLKNQFRRTTHELFKGRSFSVADMSSPVFPSTSSTFNRSRSKGGQVSELIERVIAQTDLFFFADLANVLKTEPLTVFQRYLNTEKFGEEGKEEDTIYRDPLYREMCDNLIESIGYSTDDTEFTRLYRAMYWKAFKLALQETPCVEPVALAEALKIRVITKGPALTYFVLKTFQKFLWKALKENCVFSLIGRPCEVSDIIRVCGDDPVIIELLTIISGDYVASTDNLHSFVSETIMDQLAIELNLSEDFLKLCLRALTGHKFPDYTYYGVVNKGSRDKDEFGGLEFRILPGYLDQVTGQLMGSIISFPVLCIANASLCRYALELADNRTYTLRDYKDRKASCPLLVNGDDCLLASLNPALKRVWETLTKAAGLESSVGKTYFSNKFAVINSEHYDFDQVWKKRLYLNMGLVKGMKRSAESQTDGVSLSQLGPIHKELYKSCPNEVWDSANELFHYYNGNTLKSYKGPWYLPTWLGGLGLVPRPGTFNQDTLRAAAYMKILISDKKGPLAWPLGKEWMMHDIVKERYKELYPLAVDSRHEEISIKLDENNGTIWRSLEKANNHAYKLVTIETLFRDDMERLRRSNGKSFRSIEEQELKVARYNSTVWMKAMNQNYIIKDLRPMTESDFDFAPSPTMIPLI